MKYFYNINEEKLTWAIYYSTVDRQICTTRMTKSVLNDRQFENSFLKGEKIALHNM